MFGLTVSEDQVDGGLNSYTWTEEHQGSRDTDWKKHLLCRRQEAESKEARDDQHNLYVAPQCDLIYLGPTIDLKVLEHPEVVWDRLPGRQTDKERAHD